MKKRILWLIPVLCLALLLAGCAVKPDRVLPTDDFPGPEETGEPAPTEDPTTTEEPTTTEDPSETEDPAKPNPGEPETPDPGEPEKPDPGEPEKPDSAETEEPGGWEFRLILADPDKSSIIREPCGVYSYYGPGETVLSLIIPYTKEGEKTVYDCLVAYDREHEEISFTFRSEGGYLFLSDITYKGEKISSGTNYLILFNGEYCEYCLDNISPAGKDASFTAKEDNLRTLTLVRGGWCGGTMS